MHLDPLLVVLYLVGINILTFVLYGLDKRAARNGDWRIPENSLLMCAFLGGSPAALAAKKYFRHKRRKSEFMVKYWLVVVAQLGLLWYAAAQGVFGEI